MRLLLIPERMNGAWANGMRRVLEGVFCITVLDERTLAREMVFPLLVRSGVAVVEATAVLTDWQCIDPPHGGDVGAQARRLADDVHAAIETNAGLVQAALTSLVAGHESLAMIGGELAFRALSAGVHVVREREFPTEATATRRIEELGLPRVRVGPAFVVVTGREGAGATAFALHCGLDVFDLQDSAHQALKSRLDLPEGGAGNADALFRAARVLLYGHSDVGPDLLLTQMQSIRGLADRVMVVTVPSDMAARLQAKRDHYPSGVSVTHVWVRRAGNPRGTDRGGGTVQGEYEWIVDNDGTLEQLRASAAWLGRHMTSPNSARTGTVTCSRRGDST